MLIKGIIKKGAYFDSVSLMLTAQKASSLEGVRECSLVMGTNENKSILKTSDMLTPEFEAAVDSDLIIAVKAENDELADKALAQIEKMLKKSDDSPQGSSFKPRSIEGALKVLPNANIAIISVAGKYAAKLADEALDKGLNVMLFSDNVSVEDERSLKLKAAQKDLIVMGPDCGTAIINGVPLAFANNVNKGDIGCIGASGTGLQEVTCLVSNNGAGISQAIGTGGRDVKEAIGGIAFLQAVEALKQDGNTKIILLVSKPPHKDVLYKILESLKHAGKPVVSVFLGGEHEADYGQFNVTNCATLEEAALRAVNLSKNLEFVPLNDDGELERIAYEEAVKLKPEQKYLRGLFSGGTFVSEAQIVLNDIGEISSNAPMGNNKKTDNPLLSEGHTVIDFGEDEFTVGRPHPMIDFTLRNKRIIAEASDGTTAVILLDIVIGYGANMTPVEDIVPALNEAKNTALSNDRYIPVVACVTGTDMDPQNRSHVVKELQNAGVIVMHSNAQACRLAGKIIKAVK